MFKVARTAVLFISAVVGCAASGGAGAAESVDATPWPAMGSQTRPWTRWWWLGSAVDKPNLTRMLEQFKEAGIGGVEICPIYGAKGYENQFIEFLSPKWMEMLAHTTTEAKRLGLGVDMTTGTGWPFGGPMVSATDASAKANLKSYSVAGGAALKERLPDGRLQCLVAVSDSGERVDLLAKVKDGSIDWTAPVGTWKVYAIAMSGPVQKVKRAAPGGVGNVLDPFSTEKLGRFLGVFDRAFEGFAAPMPRSQFHDSYEYYNANWTEDLFNAFQGMRGYDLRSELPALFGEGPADTVARVKCDYRETISDMHRTYISQWTDWAHRHGCLARNQAHGGPGNLLDAYAAADIPECEIYGQYAEQHIPWMKLSSSAAHVTGRNLASSESFTWLGEHFQVPLSHVKPAADFLFLSGVNHMFFHGIPYSPADAPWPGWQFYAAVNFGPQGGLWHDLPAFNSYVARCQSILQAGRPANDVLLYFPWHDVWQTSAGFLLTFTAPGTWMENLPVHADAMTLWKLGYGFDEVSDKLLGKAQFIDGGISLGGNSYRVIVVPKARYMSELTLGAMLKLALNGATVIFHESLPSDVPGLGLLEGRRARLKDLLDGISLSDADATNIRRAKVGEGLVLVGPELQALLAAAKVSRESIADSGIRFVRRRIPGGYYYFLVNRSDVAIDNWVTLGAVAKSAAIFDPMFESRAGIAAVRVGPDGTSQVYLQLKPGQSLILKTQSDDSLRGRRWRYTQAAGEGVAISGGWNVQFVDGGPEMPGGFETTELKSWTDLSDAKAKEFAGSARYSIEFELSGKADDYVLELGKVCESARVSVNGKLIGTLIASPFELPIGEYLRAGRNKLEVEVTNLAANRIAAMDRRKVNWKYFYDANVASQKQRGIMDASGWAARQSGLIGPVRLIPMKKIQP